MKTHFIYQTVRALFVESLLECHILTDLSQIKHSVFCNITDELILYNALKHTDTQTANSTHLSQIKHSVFCNITDELILYNALNHTDTHTLNSRDLSQIKHSVFCNTTDELILYNALKHVHTLIHQTQKI